MEEFERALALLPPEMRAAVAEAAKAGGAEELRLRRGRAPAVVSAGREYTAGGERITADMLRYVVERATGSSFHAAESQLRRGYIAAGGGLRIGVCGTAVMSGDEPAGLRDISSLSVRIPCQAKGCADGIWRTLTEGGFSSALIVGTPGAGKTTLLRELIRKLSDSGYGVAVADERGELSGMSGGEPRYDLGMCTDVLVGWPKASASVMLLRTMTPRIVAFDEITDEGDAAALMGIAGCGAELLCTVHGYDRADICRRPVCRRLLEQGIFSRLVTVRAERGCRTYEAERLI